MTILAITLLLIIGVMLAGGFWEFVAICIGILLQLVIWAVYISLWLLVVIAFSLIPLAIIGG